MDLISSDAIQESYYISKKIIYTRNQFYSKISNIVSSFNADAFANWMKSGYSKDKYGSYENFAKIVKSNPATISRLMNGSKQTLTNKPSQPKPDLVIRLAVEFKNDIDEALILAGHAPSGASGESHNILDVANISFQSKKFTKAQKERLLEIMLTATRGVLAESEEEAS